MHSQRRSGRLAGSLAVTLFASFALSACGPATKLSTVDVWPAGMRGGSADSPITATEDGFSLKVVGSVCDGELEATATVDHQRREVRLAGRGRLPDNEFGYCYRYIDTGGSGTEGAERTVKVRLRPGTYRIRGREDVAIEVRLAKGEITTSFPYRDFETWDEYHAQLAGTERVARDLAATLNQHLDQVEPREPDRLPPTWEYSCHTDPEGGPTLPSPDTQDERRLPDPTASCYLRTPGTLRSPPEVGPLTAETLTAIGCQDIVSADAPRRMDDFYVRTMNCTIASTDGGPPRKIAAAAEYSKEERDGAVLWSWEGFYVWEDR